MKKFLLILAIVLTAFSVNAATLKWDTPTGVVAGYYTHYGTESGVYTDRIDVGNVIEVVDMVATFGLSPETKYFFVVSAYNDAGEGDVSNEASYTTPFVLVVPGTVTITISTE